MFNEKHFPMGSILAYYNDPHNPPHHTTPFGGLIAYVQSYFSRVDPRATHVSLIDRVSEQTPEPGFTNMVLFDILKDKSVTARRVEHNYAYDIYALRRDRVIHPDFTPQDLAQKAMSIARDFMGMPYRYTTLLEVICYQQKPDASYIENLCKRFAIDFDHETIEIDNLNDGLICSEYVIACYQIAWLMLDARTNKSSQRSLPDWLNIHCRSTPAEVAQWLSENRNFQLVPPDCTYELRNSGTPDPRDQPPPESVRRTWMARGYHQAQPQPTIEEPVLTRRRSGSYTQA